jgi:hypothetical protein
LAVVVKVVLQVIVELKVLIAELSCIIIMMRRSVSMPQLKGAMVEELPIVGIM